LLAFGGHKGLGGSTGPLRSSVMDKSRVSSSNVGFIGDAGPGDMDEAVLALDLRYDASSAPAGSMNVFARGTDSERSFIVSGDFLTEAFNDGPAYWSATDVGVKLMRAGENVGLQRQCERGNATTAACAAPTGNGGNGIYLQDTRDWFAIHAKGANILMADGSVKTFSDSDGDGYLNPGFPVPNTLTEAEVLQVGYAGSTVEMTKDQFFAGIFLDESVFKGVFED